MLVIRKLLDFVFTQEELKVLDDKMPESKRKKKLEKKIKSQEKQANNKKSTLLAIKLNKVNDDKSAWFFHHF